jgi:hypothetical protein
MTIANDISNAADFVCGFSLRHEAIPPRTAAHLAVCLMELADRVKHLEVVPLQLDAPEVRLGFHQLHMHPDDDCLT